MGRFKSIQNKNNHRLILQSTPIVTLPAEMLLVVIFFWHVAAAG